MSKFELKLEKLQPLLESIESIKKDRISIFLLIGDLGSGKSTLVREFAKYLGFECDVTSPTFSIMNHYKHNEESIYHIDLYNKGVDSFLSLGLIDEFENSGYFFVEWPCSKFIKLLVELKYSYATIKIEHLKEDSREYRIEKCTL